MATDRGTRQYVSTGIDGLDYILLGGFLREGFYLVQGDPGSGKTTLALQFAIECMRNSEKVLYITLSESLRDLEHACRSHGWCLDGIKVADLSISKANINAETDFSIFHPSEIELGETAQQIMSEVEAAEPSCVVFDGLAELRLLAGEPLIYRRQLLAMKRFFEQRRITVLVLDDRSGAFDQIQPESLVDGNVVMEKYLPGYGGARRRIHVSKVRGAHFRDGYHDYDITTGGVLVHPRLVAGDFDEEFERENFTSNVPALDQMLGGGLCAGTTTLLLGPAGVGKSTVSMTYVATALAKGHRAAVYTFDEVLDTLFERSEKLCSEGIRTYQKSGQLHAKQVDPAELSPGAFAHEVRQRVEEGIRVLVIDSLNGYLSSMPEERFLTTHLHELFAYLNQQGIVTIVVVAQHGLLQNQAQELDASYLADTVLLFRYFEAHGEILQALSVFKKRTGGHERSLRQLKITSAGVNIGEPLQKFRGILTGVPEYDGSTRMLPDGGSGEASI